MSRKKDKTERLNILGKIQTTDHPNDVIKILNILNGDSKKDKEVVTDYLESVIISARKGDKEACSMIIWLIQGNPELQKKFPYKADEYQGLLQIMEDKKYHQKRKDKAEEVYELIKLGRCSPTSLSYRKGGRSKKRSKKRSK